MQEENKKTLVLTSYLKKRHNLLRLHRTKVIFFCFYLPISIYCQSYRFLSPRCCPQRYSSSIPKKEYVIPKSIFNICRVIFTAALQPSCSNHISPIFFSGSIPKITIIRYIPATIEPTFRTFPAILLNRLFVIMSSFKIGFL